ncbi:hypothetical protein KDA11_02895 [Candidatus Saccharibacteria bacterium]|nr:hypothetical protein [Candidatus Saccharibacteria bacterium]
MKINYPLVVRYFLALGAPTKENAHCLLRTILHPDVTVETRQKNPDTQQETVVVKCSGINDVLAILDKSIFDNVQEGDYHLVSYLDDQEGNISIELSCVEDRKGNGTEQEGPGRYVTAGSQLFKVVDNQIVSINILITHREKV